MASVLTLNGPSSAGKTTLAHALRARLGPLCVALSVDDFYKFVHADAPNNWQLFSTLTSAMFATAASFVDAGLDVIVDTVFERRDSYETARSVLAHRTQRYIAVTAPLELLESREQARGNRRIGQARRQRERVLHDVAYDLVLDTGSQSLDECVTLLLDQTKR
jgi:chloramphenicol 3-O phosphotransferase